MSACFRRFARAVCFWLCSFSCLGLALFLFAFSCYNCSCVSLVVPCLFSFRLPCLLAPLCLVLVWFLSVFRVLVLRLLVLRLLFLRCCLPFLLACVCLWVVRVALTRFVGLSLLVLPRCWCSLLPLGGLVLGVLLLPVGLLAVCCLWLLILVVCWWLCLLLLFLPLGCVLHADKSFVVRFLVVVWVVLRGLGVRWLLPSVAVVGCCCGCPLVLVLLPGLVCPGRPLVRLVLLAAGGSVFPFLLLPRACSCRFFSWVAGFVVGFSCSFVGRGS